VNSRHAKQQIEQGASAKGYTYTEQIVWREAATGKILAQSDFFPAMSLGILLTPGYGSIIYELFNNVTSWTYSCART
jgi:hypothetical protein